MSIAVGHIPSVCLIAETGKASGIATAARGTLQALRSAGVKVTVVDPSNPLDASLLPRADINLVQVNPDYLGRLMRGAPELARVLSARPTIGYWVWEAPGVPHFWKPFLPMIQELWVPSTFVGKCVGDDLAIPLHVMPHALSLSKPSLNRSQLGLPSDKFIFLFTGNARSNLKRKNPMGLIRAYRKAFEDSGSNTLLVVKMVHTLVEELSSLRRAISNRSDILLISRMLDGPATASLLATCDCYISLHRAEGFGLGLAEAMLLARPVIATGYSGNMDFMTPDTAYLVESRPMKLPNDAGIFGAGTVFGDPDEAHAARLMRHVVHHRNEAADTGHRASNWIATNLSPQSVGKKMRARLASFWVTNRASAQS